MLLFCCCWLLSSSIYEPQQQYIQLLYTRYISSSPKERRNSASNQLLQSTLAARASQIAAKLAGCQIFACERLLLTADTNTSTHLRPHFPSRQAAGLGGRVMGMHVPSPVEEGELPPCPCFVIPSSAGRDRRGEFRRALSSCCPYKYSSNRAGVQRLLFIVASRAVCKEALPRNLRIIARPLSWARS